MGHIAKGKKLISEVEVYYNLISNNSQLYEFQLKNDMKTFISNIKLCPVPSYQIEKDNKILKSCAIHRFNSTFYC